MLVICCGPHSAELEPALPIRPLCRQLFETQPLDLADDLPMVIEEETGFHFRRRDSCLRVAMPDEEARWGFETEVDETVLDDRLERLRGRFPAAEGADTVDTVDPVDGLDREERFVPAHDLDDRVELAKGRHDLGRGSFVSFAVHGEEDRVRASARRGTQRQSGVHAEGAGLVGSGADHPALGRVTGAADHHRESPQLRVTQNLDGGDELVEVDVQYPPSHALV